MKVFLNRDATKFIQKLQKIGRDLAKDKGKVDLYPGEKIKGRGTLRVGDFRTVKFILTYKRSGF